MNKKATQRQAIDLILIINAPITNLRLYPPTNPLIVNSIGRLYASLISILEQTDSIEYAESEKKLLVQGEPISEKEMARSQIKSFLKLMLDLKVRSISFEIGFTKDELTEFLQIIGKPINEIEEAGGILQFIADRRIDHIRVDEKIYVERDSEKSIVASMQIKDEDIVRLITGGLEITDEVQNLARELVNDPGWIARVFQAGVKQVVQEAHNFQKNDLSMKISEMISSLSKLSGRDKTDISRAMLSSLPDMDDTMLLAVMSQNLDDIFGAGMFQEFIEQLDDETFQRLLDKIRKLGKEALKEGKQSQRHIHSMHRIFKMMVHSEKGKTLLGKEKIEEFLKEAPEQLEKSPSKEVFSAVATLFDQMNPLLFHQDEQVRTTVARMMSHIDEKLQENGLWEERIELSRKLTEWIKSETIVSPVYKKITENLENLSRELIQNDRSEDAGHILEAYSLIYSKNLSKDEAIQALSLNMLQHLATDDILNFLLRDTRKDGTQKRQDDLRSLIILGTTSIERLLDRLHDSQNRQERNRIIQVIVKIGKPAIQSIVERIQQQGHWYYIRNLILMLGRIGDQSHVGTIIPLIGHKELQVQKEAVFAIGNLGGKLAGDSLVDHLSSVNDDIKSLIISVLGTMKYKEAGPELINILESKAAGVNKKAKNDIMIKACEALTKIGVKEAVPALEKIVQTKGFLSIKPYDASVRTAAIDSLTKLT